MMSTNNTPGPQDRFAKAVLWGVGGWVAWKLLSPETKASITSSLNQLGVALQREEERKRAVAEVEERRRRAQQVMAALGNLASPAVPAFGTKSPAALPVSVTPPISPVTNSPPASPTGLQVEPDAAWRQKIVHPSVVMILGKRGSGKSALGYRLLELFRYVGSPYVVGVLASARRLLPDWIGIAPTLEEVPHKAVALVDEAYLTYHARGSMARESKAMSQLLNLSRQREQTIIFVTQEARQADRNIASSANVIVFKDLGILQLEFERPELNKLAAQAREAFATVQGDRRRWSFVYAPDADFIGLQESTLPTFWEPALSRLFAAEAARSPLRAPARLTPQEKAAKARAMRAQGASYRQIADALGVSRSTAVNYIKGYPGERG